MDTSSRERRRHRSWPEALKREIVAASFAPGSSVSVIARRYDVNANQVFGWRIGHIKAEHRMDRNYLKGRDGDRSNAVLAAAGYNFSLLLRWLAALLRALIAMLHLTAGEPQNA